MTDPQNTSLARLTFYRHNTKELGHEVPTPKNLTLNTKLDVDRLEVELEDGAADIEAAAKNQRRILYDAPSREELRDIGRGVGEAAKNIGGLFRRRQR
jgi:hypothetical protein